MAMFIGDDRETVLRKVAAARRPLEITIGRGLPTHVIAAAEGSFSIARLTVDQQAETRFLAAHGTAPYAPEMRMRFLVRGEVLYQGAERDAFIAFLGRFPWP